MGNKSVEVPVPSYKLSKSVEKFLWGFISAGVVSALSYFIANSDTLGTQYPQYTVLIGCAVGIARFIVNYLKHKDDVEFVNVEND